MSRAAEVGRVRHWVIPLIRDKGGKPYLDGSAVALVYRGRKVLVTALHVSTANKDRPLFFVRDSYVLPLRVISNIPSPITLRSRCSMRTRSRS